MGNVTSPNITLFHYFLDEMAVPTVTVNLTNYNEPEPPISERLKLKLVVMHSHCCKIKLAVPPPHAPSLSL